MLIRDHALIPDVKRIAVLRPNAVGDFMFVLPALHALKQAYPGARLTYIGKPWHAQFLQDRPGPIDDVVVIPPCPGVGAPADAQVDTQDEGTELQSFIDRMQREEFDLAFQVYGGGRYANPFTKRLGARCTMGLKAEDAEPLDRWIAFGSPQNRRLQLLEVAGLAGANTVRIGRDLEVTASDRREAQRILPDPLSRPLVTLQPGASDSRRCWPAARFSALGDALAETGALIAVNGTKAEAPIVHAVIDSMHHPAIDLSGKLSLNGLCGWMERSALVVSNDTGPLHLALAIGTPCVGIYWLTNLVESAPLAQRMHRSAMSVRIHCPVCGEANLTTRCPHDLSFLDTVPAEEVIEAALELLRLSRLLH